MPGAGSPPRHVPTDGDILNSTGHTLKYRNTNINTEIHYSLVKYSQVQFSGGLCSPVQFNTVYWSVVQLNIVQCSKKRFTVLYSTLVQYSALGVIGQYSVQCAVCSVQCEDKGCVVGWWDSSCVLPQGVMVPEEEGGMSAHCLQNDSNRN